MALPAQANQAAPASGMMAARLARARQSNKESGKEDVVLTGAAMHAQPSSSQAGPSEVWPDESRADDEAVVQDPEQRQMLQQMERQQEELEQQQLELEERRRQPQESSSAVLPSGADASPFCTPRIEQGVTMPASWLLQPAQRGAPMVQCLVKRERSGLGFYPTYRMFIQRDDGDVFALAARRRKGVMSEGHSFLISRDPKDLEKGPNYVGKLRSNLIGTEWMLYDCGIRPDKLAKIAAGGGEARRELAFISSQQNVVGPAKPRCVRVTMPQLDESGQQPRTLKPTSADASLPSLARGNQLDAEQYMFFANKDTTPNPVTGRHTLNFNGRVSKASVKNFQLVSPEAPEQVVLQFGKVAKDEYILDFGYPYTPLQALGMALVSLAYKLANEGG